MFEYTTTLHKIRAMDQKIRIVCGGSSAGKTYAIIPIIIDMLIKGDKLLASVVSESMPHLRRGAIRDFINIMKDTGRWIRSHWNKTTSTYTFSNGSVLEFFSADQPDKLRGARRNILFVNECNNIDMESFNQLVIRTQSKYSGKTEMARTKIGATIFLDYNPVGPFWIDRVKKDIHSQFVRVTYRDNEVVSQDVVDFFKQREEWAKTDDYWANWVKVFVNGLQGQLMGAIFDDYKTCPTSTIDKLITNGKLELLGRGIDFGYSDDPLAVSEVWLDDSQERHKLYLREVIYKTDTLNSDLFKELKDRGIHTRDNIYIADSAEPKSIAELRKYGLRIKGVKKSGGTKGSSINYGINLMKEHELIVDESSINLVNEMNNYKWQTNRSGDSLTKPEDKNNHLIDSIRYLCMERVRFNKDTRPSVIF